MNHILVPARPGQGMLIMVKNNRKRTRVSVHFEIAVLPEGATIPINAQIVNISLTGILCTSHPLFQKDTPCKVILSLSDEAQIAMDSKILRVGTQETAISFSSMDEESFSLLKKVVQYNTTDPDIIDKELRIDAFDRMPDQPG
jgi:hypothetical protein